MSDMENARAREEAVEAAARATSSANRQRLWAGMNRYLAAETEHAHRAAVQEKQDELEKDEEKRDEPERDEPTRAPEQPDPA